MHLEHRKIFWERAGWKPYPKQLEVLNSTRRTIMLSGGEQSGKTLAGSMWDIGEMYQFGARYGGFPAGASEKQQQELGWIVGKHYDMTRFAYDYIGQALQANGVLQHMSSSYNPGLIIAAGNQVIRTKSALDVESLMGEAPDWIHVDEAAQLPFEALYRIIARSGPKKARILLTGTMEGSVGWFPETYDLWQDPYVQQTEDAQSFRLQAPDNIHLYPGGRNDPEIKRLEARLPPDSN